RRCPKYLVVSFRCRIVPGEQLRPPLVIETAGPCLPDKIFSEKELPVGAVEQVVKAIPGGPCQQLPRPVLIGSVQQDGELGSVPIVRVVRSELKMPPQLSRVGIEREHGTCVQVIALSKISVVIRPWIACSPEQRVGFGIVGAVIPGRDAAGFPGVSGPGP